MSRVAVVGSSPQLLVQAIRLADAGATVTVHEGNARLGGAWATTSFAGFHRVEVACHLLERDEVGYAVLRDLGVELAPMTPQPRTVLRPGMSHAYVAPLTAAAQLAFYPVARATRRRSLDRQGWQRRRSLAVKELVDSVVDRSPVLGLTGGAGQLIGALVDRCTERGIDIRESAPVEKIRCADDGITLTGNAGVESFDQVIISAAFAPERLVVDGVPTPRIVRRRTYVHRLLAMPAGSVAPHSYIRFPRDPVLQRCSLVTHSAIPGGDADADLLLVSVRCDERGAPLHDLETTLARLATHELIDDAKPAAEEVHVYVGANAEPALRRAIEGRCDIRVLDSFGDLTRALSAEAHASNAVPVVAP